MSAYVCHVTPSICGTWAEKIRIANAFTNPVRTDRETNRISTSSLSSPKTT